MDKLIKSDEPDVKAFFQDPEVKKALGYLNWPTCHSSALTPELKFGQLFCKEGHRVTSLASYQLLGVSSQPPYNVGINPEGETNSLEWLTVS